MNKLSKRLSAQKKNLISILSFGQAALTFGLLRATSCSKMTCLEPVSCKSYRSSRQENLLVADYRRKLLSSSETGFKIQYLLTHKLNLSLNLVPLCAQTEAPQVRKFGYLCIYEHLVLTKSAASPHVCPPFHVSECEMSYPLASKSKPYTNRVLLDIEHSCYDHMTAVKIGYSLTSTT